MLVLTRQRDQSVVIGDDIVVTIVDIRGDKVRLGITAPRDVTVHRKEIWDQIKTENESAGQLQPKDVPSGLVTAPVNSEHTQFMNVALEEAAESLKEGGIPIGAVLVRNGQIIGRGRNRRVQDKDPMAQAALLCIHSAGREPHYKDATLYCTVTPSILCGGAILQFGIGTVVVGDAASFKGGAVMLRNQGVKLINLADIRAMEITRHFIAAQPQLWAEHSGR